MTNELNTIAEELRTTAISKLPEAISVSEGDCILVVQNRKAKRARPSLFRGPKGDTGMTGTPGTIGPTGASPVLRYTTRGIESKLSNQPDTEFTLLVPIADMTGPQGTTGANIVLRAGDTGIEFKLSTEPDSAYKVLVPYLQITGPKGDTGPAPILELGEVTTVEPSDPASATFQPNGVDPSGANKYRLALSIPKGKSGQDGTGAGNVLVNNEASLLASKQYAFKPGQDGSVNGAFVEVEAPGGAIEIPFGIMELDTSATSEQILAVWPMEDILKVIKGKPGGGYYIHGDGGTVYVQVIATISEDPTVTPHDVTLSIPVIPPEEHIMQVINYSLETNESTVSITGVVYDFIGNYVDTNGIENYNGLLVPIKDKESGIVVFIPWYSAASYQYVIFDIDDFKTDTSAQIKEKLKRSLIIAERVDAGDTEFSALRNILYAYGSVFGITRSGSLMFMDSSIVGESSVAMYFKGGETLYTVTISEDPTTKDLSATVVESSIGQLETSGDGSKFLSNDGTYKTVSGGESGVYRLPEAIINLDESSTSDEIFAAWGGREVLLDFVKNYDASKAYIVSTSEIRTTYNAQIYCEYTDDTNFVAMVIIGFGGDNIIMETRVADGLASVYPSSIKIPILTSTSDDVYFTYSTNDGELMWANNGVGVGGAGLRYAAYSKHKNVKIEDNGDGTQFLSNDGTYKAISSDAGNIYHLDLDISGYMSRATEAEQTAVWGKMYTAPTSENIITLLGGAEGVRQLCEKLKPTNNPIVTVPYMLYFLPTRLLSTSVSILIADSTSLTNILSSPRDGCYINIALMFYTRINDPISIMVNLTIANFNTDTQEVLYQYAEDTEFVHIEDSLFSTSTSDALSANQGGILKERIDKKVGSEEITTIKKLTQAAYDALSSKDSKTLYACMQSNGTIIMR